MALDKLVDSSQLDADLTTVADAIRAKGGTSAQLAFPQGMADAVAAIPTGQGETYPDLSDAPIPEGYVAVIYAAVDASAKYPHTSSGSTTTNMKGVVERGTLSNGIWAAQSSAQFSGSPNLDWSDVTSGYVIFRFLLNAKVNSNVLLADYIPSVAIKIYDNDSKSFTAGSGWWIKQFIREGRLEHNAIASMCTALYAQTLSYSIEEINLENLKISLGASSRLFYNALSNRSSLTRFKLKNAENIEYAYTNFAIVFSGCESLEELDISMIRLIAASGAKLDSAFDGCVNLSTLYMSDWGNLSNVSSMSNVWRDCYMLENANFDGTTFPALAINFAQSFKLTDTSLASIANALPVSNKTLTLHATPKARLSTIKGTVEEGVFSADEDGDTTLLSFINTTKGWTVA